MTDLIAETESTPGTEGSGSVGDVIHLAQDLSADGLGWNSAFDAGMIGIDFLSWAGNPFGGLIAAGVGWLLEHLRGIDDIWDKLTGDAGKIEQTAATWENIARALDSARESYADASTEIERWAGDAADSYRRCADAYASSIGSTATQAEAFAYVVKGVGGLVATTKDVVYTIIAEFIEFTVIPAMLSALATAWFTFGSSIGVAIAYIEVQADFAGVEVVGRIELGSEEVVIVSDRTLTSVSKLFEMSDSLSAFGEALEESTSKAAEFVRALVHSGAEQGRGTPGGGDTESGTQ